MLRLVNNLEFVKDNPIKSNSLRSWSSSGSKKQLTLLFLEFEVDFLFSPKHQNTWFEISRRKSFDLFDTLWLESRRVHGHLICFDYLSKIFNNFSLLHFFTFYKGLTKELTGAFISWFFCKREELRTQRQFQSEQSEQLPSQIALVQKLPACISTVWSERNWVCWGKTAEC